MLDWLMVLKKYRLSIYKQNKNQNQNPPKKEKPLSISVEGLRMN
jgi:hypothetical protein